MVKINFQGVIKISHCDNNHHSVKSLIVYFQHIWKNKTISKTLSQINPFKVKIIRMLVGRKWNE